VGTLQVRSSTIVLKGVHSVFIEIGVKPAAFWAPAGAKKVDFFARQRLANPIKTARNRSSGDKRSALPVQNILKKVKKSLVRPHKLA